MNFNIMEFDPERQATSFRQTRQWEKQTLKAKLAQAEKWKKRLEILEDSSIENLVSERLKKLHEECTKQGLVFNKIENTRYGFGATHTTSFVKDKVNIKGLYSSLTINPDGSVYMDVYRIPEKAKRLYSFRPSAADKVIRIFVSDGVRVTNNVLRTLMKV